MSQSGWHWCKKCQGMYFTCNNSGVCPAGGAHDDTGSRDHVLSESGSGQSDWRWCNKCQGLFWAKDSLGVCPSHSHSDVGSANYVLSSSSSGSSNWRWCNKCQGMYFAGNSSGVCPAGLAGEERSTHMAMRGSPRLCEVAGLPAWRALTWCDAIIG